MAAFPKLPPLRLFQALVLLLVCCAALVTVGADVSVQGRILAEIRRHGSGVVASGGVRLDIVLRMTIFMPVENLRHDAGQDTERV